MTQSADHWKGWPKEKKLALLRRLNDRLAQNAWAPIPGSPQERAYHSKADILLFGGSAGGGKLLALDTPLPTPTGWTIMGDIAVGDLIFNEAGEQVRVEVVSPITTAKTYALRFDDGTAITACADHLWLTFDSIELAQLRNTARAALRPDNLPIGSVRTTQTIVDTLLARGGRTNHAVPVASAIQCEPADLPIDPYTLGAWLGDGSSGGLTSIDQEVWNEIERAGYVVTHAKVEAKAHLKDMNVLHNKHVPEIYMRGSRHQRLALLQGLMDTDGHAALDGGCEFDNTNYRLIEAVYELVVSLGIKASITNGIAKLRGRAIGPKWRVKFATDEPVFKLARKLSRLRPGRRTREFRYIVDAIEVDPVPMRCIAVDSPSHLYLAGRSMIPTHNTDLILGLAHNSHTKSLILRSQYPQLKTMMHRAEDLFGDFGRMNHSSNILKLHNGKSIEFGACSSMAEAKKWQGRDHDLVGFDEITHFSRPVFDYLCGWNRSANHKQRCRIVCTGNPPMDDAGTWITDYWGILNTSAGEFQWYTVIAGKDAKRPNSDPVKVGNDWVQPRSRAFIPARVQDNPYLAGTGYISTLQAMPEPYRSRLLYGDFSALDDADVFQVLPTGWVKAAQDRWAYARKPDQRISALGVDAARGGADEMVLSPRYGVWLGEQIAIPGKDVPDGPSACTHIMQHRDTAPVHLDIVGVGGSIYDILVANEIPTIALNGSQRSDSTDRSGKLKFFNKRAQWYWEMREALDPISGYGLCLPPDMQLQQDLCAARWMPVVGGVKIEDKLQIKARLGRSPDRGEAAIYSLAESSVNELSMDMFMVVKAGNY